MANVPVFWLGPLGRLVPLGCPESGLSNSIQMQAAVNTSVNMHNTVDLQGFRRTWTMDQAWLDENDVSALEAMFTGMIMPPLRIIDPLKTNRFRPSVAVPRVTSLWNGGLESWALTRGEGTVKPLPNPGHPDFTYADEGRSVAYRPDSGVTWNPSKDGAVLYPNGPRRANGALRKSTVDPVLPGEVITVSFWLKTTGTGTATFGLSTVAPDLTGSFGTALTFNNTAWQRLHLTYPVPEDGSVIGLAPYFSGANALDVQIGPGQLEAASEPSPWQAGYGAPEVVITQFDSVSPRFPLVTASLTILEL
ncbi:hypothetical protein [Amycolatopsis minnesotensis]|uniref:Minor tail protein n=1 Tax=Amycolatopsis minnesotensis TaxID=337894 RepID=A0ABP5BEY8_9PSEU